jgi:homoserine dehydrogenase
VLGDLVAVARNRLVGAAGQGPTGYADLPIRPMADTPTQYHVSLDVADKPGVLAAVAQEFAHHGVSISTVRQNGHGDAATLVIVTHSAPDAALSATVAALRGMSAVREVTSVLRVEGLS